MSNGESAQLPQGAGEEQARMPTPEPSVPLALALELASRAGTLALEWFRQPLSIEVKADASPVTLADQGIEAMLRQALAERYPSHGILGEEYGIERLDAEYTWVIDPIDGTRSFITGWPLWGCLIGLLRQGIPALGVIEVPAVGERWHAARGQGAFMRDNRGVEQRCQVSSCRRLAEARFYTTSPRYFDASEQPRIDALIAEAGVTRFGGDCYSYGLLAAGFIDLVVESQLQPFDYLPLLPVVEEAGGVMTDWEGKPLTLQSDGRVIAAATAELHREVLQRLHR